MSITAVGQCPQCHAVVNVHWSSCLVCHALLIAGPFHETEGRTSAPPAHSQATTTEVTAPTPPLQPGWLVAYRNRTGVLCGGCDGRQHGTVEVCQWDGNGWTVELTDGQRLRLSAIRSVGKTDSAGQVVSAWMVREHGYDGSKTEGGKNAL